MPINDWNEKFPSNQPNQSHQTVEIEFDDDSAPRQQKSSPIQKLYEPVNINNINSSRGDYRSPAAKPPPNLPVQPQSSQNDITEKERKSKTFSYNLDGGILMTCKIEEWSKGFTLFGDFLRDAKKYYRKTCINANYIYFFSYRPMYRELSHEQLCWYLFWRSRVREGTYPKTGLSYIFLYLYEQINLADIIGYEKVYANIIKIWKNYRTEFPRIDKYIAEWLIDFSFINKIKIDLADIEAMLPDIINIVTIPEVYMREDFFKNKNNIDLILKNLSVYDYKKSKFYNDKNEKNKELFDYHIFQILHAVMSGPGFEEIIKKEIDDGVKIRTTRESFMGAVCVYEHKKRITVEYKNLYKNFFIRQCITDTVRYAENILRDYLNIKSKLTVTAYPEQLKKIIEEYKSIYLAIVKSPKISVKTKSNKKDEIEEETEVIEFNPNIEAAAEIEKSSWDTTMTLVELQNRANDLKITEENDDIIENIENIEEIETDEIDDDGEFIAIDTGVEETYEELEEIAPQTPVGVADTPLQKGADIDIFDVLENLESTEEQTRMGDYQSPAEITENVELSDMAKFIANLNEEEHTALEMLMKAKTENKNFDMLCNEFLSKIGGMLESVIDIINEKAMDFKGDIIFDTASCEIIEDYRGEIGECLKK
ncbi:MAG: TerB N-terminal domain-containing protein [Oscillospiraceae bacterium]|nr:TerB N-terminal domain-containing protein [Oscillospiraceae bacterium]